MTSELNETSETGEAEELNFDFGEIEFEDTPNEPDISVGEFANSNSDSPAPNEFYFDLETIPDESRLDLFDEIFGELPPPYKPCKFEDCPDELELLKGSLGSIEDQLFAMSPPMEYLIGIVDVENGREKPRAGIKAAVTKLEKKMEEYERAVEARIKLLSLTPECCSIACFAWAGWTGEPVSLLVTNPNEERGVLEAFWKFVSDPNVKIIGYNIVHFDIPVILARSLILGVEPSRTIDLSRYQNNRDCVDLCLRKFGPNGSSGVSGVPRGTGLGGLKNQAKLYGVKVPVEDMDGSKVYESMKTEEGRALVKQYAASDVFITRELCRKWRGVFV